MKQAAIQVTLLDSCGTDLSVVNAARVSFEKESEFEFESIPGVGMIECLSMKDEKLISYLARNKHTSPFNHAFASFRVKAPIFVARQLVKHKFLPWNEVSRRYVNSEPEFYVPEVWRKAAENVKQGSSDEAAEWEAHYSTDSMSKALWTYERMVKLGVCAEQARMVLPQNTMTEWIWSGTLGAWADMCRLRLDPHAQKETREVAEKIADKMKCQFPVSWAALME